jgi:hypothetical protein
VNASLVCQTCGTHARGDEIICRSCDALLQPMRPRSGAARSDDVDDGTTTRTTSPSGMAPLETADAVAPADLVACWSCRVENAVGQRFCQSCGSWLSTRQRPDAPRVIDGTIAGSSPGALPLQPRRRRRLRLPLLTTVLVLALVAVVALAVGPGRDDTDAPATAVRTGASDAAADPAAEAPAPRPDDATAPPLEITSVVSATGDQLASEEPVERSPIQASDVALETLDEPAAVGAGPTTAEATVPQPTLRPNAAPAREPAPAVAGPSGWVCEGIARIADPRGREWRVVRVRAVERGSFERVALDLQRTGTGDGPTRASARSFGTADIRDVIPRADRPSSGRTTIGVNLAAGFDGTVAITGFRPRGTEVVREVSTYPAASGSAWVAISTSGDGCVRLDAPAWRRDVATDSATLTVDVRP